MAGMSGRPAITIREFRLQIADQAAGRHWDRSWCWCDAWHQAGAATLPLIPPPWDESRDGETAFSAATG